MKILLTALIMLPAISGGVPQRTPPALPLQAIYFFHRGASDKPIWPFVLALEAPQPSDLAKIFQEPFWRHADIFAVSPQTLAAVALIIRDGLAGAKPNAPIPHTFGSFQLTFVTAQTRNCVMMTPEQSKQVFQDMMMHLDPSQATLRAYVRNLLQRLGAARSD